MPDTKSKLIDATIDVLRTDGITAVSARVVATRAEVNQALVFYHFGTLAQLIDAAARHAVDTSADRYREAFAHAGSLSALVRAGRELHAAERASGNVALMAQLMAGGQHDPALAAAARYGMDRWIDEIEIVVEHLLRTSVLADVTDGRSLAQIVCASFIGLELYDGVDTEAGAAALETLSRLAELADAVDALGPVARRAVGAGLKAGAKRSARRS